MSHHQRTTIAPLYQTRIDGIDGIASATSCLIAHKQPLVPQAAFHWGSHRGYTSNICQCHSPICHVHHAVICRPSRLPRTKISRSKKGAGHLTYFGSTQPSLQLTRAMRSLFPCHTGDTKVRHKPSRTRSLSSSTVECNRPWY